MSKPKIVTENDALQSPLKRGRASRMRWWIVWTLFGSTVINYLSRQTFSVLSPTIAAQFHFSHTDLARIFGAFQISYQLHGCWGGFFWMWLAPGSASRLPSSSTGPARARLLGSGFQNEERSVAVAIFDSGSSVGGALAALVIPGVACLWVGASRSCFLDRLDLSGCLHGCVCITRSRDIRGQVSRRLRSFVEARRRERSRRGAVSIAGSIWQGIGMRGARCSAGRSPIRSGGFTSSGFRSI
jgi:hypothetical protein